MHPGALLSAQASVSSSALRVSGTGNSLGIFILLSCLRCDSVNQDKGPVFLDLIQNAVAVSRSYQSNMTAKKQDSVQRVLETRGDQKSDENMSVPLENTGVYLHGVLCGYEFTRLPLSRSRATGVQVYQKWGKRQLAPGIRAGSHLSTGFIGTCGCKYFIRLHGGEGPRRRAENKE